jgi:hypothetical protein
MRTCLTGVAMYPLYTPCVRNSLLRWPCCGYSGYMNATGTTIATAATTLLAKAEALVASGGLTDTNRPGVYRATSSDGKRSYLCSAQFCYCHAGERGNACYHRLAAQVETARQVRESAKARGVVVLAGPSGAEMLGDDRELDLYGPAEHCGLDECDCEDYAN